MPASRTPNEGARPSRDDLERRLNAEAGGDRRWWSNGPGDRFDWHDHPFHKVLFCAEGSIVFHLREGDVELSPGDRLDIEPGTEHAATVGHNGVTCVEAPRQR
jgi:mannose-6-phosphate isomerase-like protein (cupin superfamily)